MVAVIFDELRDNLKEKYDFWEQDIRDEDVMDFPEYTLIPAIAKSENFKLYKYMPANYFNIRNFEIQIIHLSTNGVMNDIYEGIPDTDEEISYDKLQKLNDLAYMSCFSETNNNPLMWSHYADDQRGFCVEFDLKRIKDDNYYLLKHMFPVIYDSRRPIRRNLESLIESHMCLNEAIKNDYEYDGTESLDDVLPMFLVKGKDWKYEKEWRIIFSRKQMYDVNDKRLYGGNIAFRCISAIYLGIRINPEVRTNIIEIANRANTSGSHPNVYQAKLSKEGYEIEFSKIY